jgi:hypothetical protein
VIDAPDTYRLVAGEPLSRVPWASGSPRPIHASETSQIFLVHADADPVPSSESRGLALLTPDQITAVCHGAWTLAALEAVGGRIILRDEAEKTRLYALPVAPRWAAQLAKVLDRHPGLSLWD